MKAKCRKKSQLEAFYWDGTEKTLEEIRAWAKSVDFYESCIQMQDSPDYGKELFIIAKATIDVYIHVPEGDWVVFQKWIPCPGTFWRRKISIDQVWHVSNDDFKKYYKAKTCEA